MTSDGSSDATEDNLIAVNSRNGDVTSLMSENSDDTMFVSFANDLIFPNDSEVPDKFETTKAFMKEYVGYTKPPRLSSEEKRARAEERRTMYLGERKVKPPDRSRGKQRGKGRRSDASNPLTNIHRQPNKHTNKPQAITSRKYKGGGKDTDTPNPNTEDFRQFQMAI